MDAVVGATYRFYSWFTFNLHGNSNMALRKCSHNKFRETREGSGTYRCMNPKCRLVIDTNDSVDLVNGEHESINGEYTQLVILVRKK